MLIDTKTRSNMRTSSRIKKTSYLYSKRLTDIVVSIIGIIVSLPLFLVLCYLIYQKEGGPIFHREKCVGLNGKPFIKFTLRTMTNRSKVIRALPPHPYPASWDSGVPNNFTFHYGQLITYTSIGQWLEKWYLDKLPLLHHVLTGEMSLVGPSPEVHDIASFYNPHQKKRLNVKPGITGYAQVKDLTSNEYDKKVHADLYYIQSRSHVFDLKIILRAFGRVFLK